MSTGTELTWSGSYDGQTEGLSRSGTLTLIYKSLKKNIYTPVVLTSIFLGLGGSCLLTAPSLWRFGPPSHAGSCTVGTILTSPRTYLSWWFTSFYTSVRFVLFLLPIFFGGTHVEISVKKGPPSALLRSTLRSTEGGPFFSINSFLPGHLSLCTDTYFHSPCEWPNLNRCTHPDLEAFEENPKKKHKMSLGHRQCKHDGERPRHRRNSSPDSNSTKVVSPRQLDVPTFLTPASRHLLCFPSGWNTMNSVFLGGIPYIYIHTYVCVCVCVYICMYV
jgi:hypothetical protein